MKLLKFFYLFLFPIYLSGCATFTQYQSPSNGPTAKLRIKVLHSVSVFEVKDGDCNKMTHIALLGNRFKNQTAEEASIGMIWAPGEKGKIESRNYKEIIIPANKPFQIYYSGSTKNGRTRCLGNQEFEVKEGSNYELSLSCYSLYGQEIWIENGAIIKKDVASYVPKVKCKH